MTCMVQQPLVFLTGRACVQIGTDTPILDLRWTGPLKRDDEAFDQVRLQRQPGQCLSVGSICLVADVED